MDRLPIPVELSVHGLPGGRTRRHRGLNEESGNAAHDDQRSRHVSQGSELLQPVGCAERVAACDGAIGSHEAARSPAIVLCLARGSLEADQAPGGEEGAADAEGGGGRGHVDGEGGGGGGGQGEQQAQRAGARGRVAGAGERGQGGQGGGDLGGDRGGGDDEEGEQPLCGADAVLVAGGAVADVGEGEEGAGKEARGAAARGRGRVGVEADADDGRQADGGPGQRRHEQRVLDGAVDAGDGAQDGEQQRGEQLGVQGGMVGEA